jgi:hypothetical protein
MMADEATAKITTLVFASRLTFKYQVDRIKPVDLCRSTTMEIVSRSLNAQQR